MAIYVLVALGCNNHTKAHSEFNWRNETADNIWVDQASGFQIDPMCGILRGLTSGSEDSLVLPDQQFPTETTITWWLGNRESKDSAELQKSTVKIPPLPKEKLQQVLVFTFEKNRSWTTHWETSEY